MYTLHMGKFSIPVKEFSENLSDSNVLTLSITNDDIQFEEGDSFASLANLKAALAEDGIKYFIVQELEAEEEKEISIPVLTWSNETHSFLRAEYNLNPVTKKLYFNITFGVN